MINKEGWKIKKLGEECDLYQPKTISQHEMIEDGKYDVYGANGIIGKYDKYNHENSELLMTCRGATCGTMNISRPFSWINGNAMVIHPKQLEKLEFNFLHYQLKAFDLKDVITGAAQPQITRQTLTGLQITIPPLPIQQQIVSELDTLSEIIAKKNQQLAELDNLAQAIFYDMFGDPVRNEKGWEVKKLAEIGKFKNGLNYTNSEDGVSVKILGVSDFKTQITIRNTTQFVNVCLDKEPNEDFFLKENDIVFVRSNGSKELVGRSVLMDCVEEKITFSGFCIRFRMATKASVPLFLIYILTNKHFRRNLIEQGRGANINNVNQQMLSEQVIILPPIVLQTQFAEKINAIEKQKELIKKTIDDTQLLFDYTMDKYFN